MGIRIHKMIGYGLQDIANEDYEITDSRINPDGWLGERDEDKFNLEGFSNHINETLATMDEDHIDHFSLMLLQRTLKDMREYEFYHSVFYDSEYGNPNVLLFIPPGCKHWSRYDDMIDYYDPVNSNDDGIVNSVIPINRTLYPYESWINIKEMPPKRIVGEEWQALYFYRNMVRENQDLRNKLARDLGLENEEEIKTYIVPIIPVELVELIKYLKIFTNERHIYELRPMIYGYWG